MHTILHNFADLVQNIFLKHPFIAKSNILYCLLLMGH